MLTANRSGNISGERYYKWYVLGLAATTHALAVAMPTISMPVLFKEISDDLGLSLVQIGTIWGLAFLPGIVMGLIGGTFGDRFGTKRALSVFCILTGVAGAMRGLSYDFITMSITVLLYGFLYIAIPMNIHKACGVWFSSQRLGLANGVVAVGMAFGFMVGSIISATVLSPWLGSWRRVLFFYGGITIIIGILWSLTRTAPGERQLLAKDGKKVSFLQTLLYVLRVKRIWFLGLALFGTRGCIQGMLGYLPLYLRGAGWTGAAADGTLGAFHGFGMAGVIPIVLLSDKYRIRKPVLMAAVFFIATGTGLLSVSTGALVWILVIMAGFMRDGYMAVFMTTITESKGIGPEHTGTGIGVTLAFSGIGSLLAPPIGNSLARFYPGLPFVFWGVLGGMSVIVLYLFKELESG